MNGINHYASQKALDFLKIKHEKKKKWTFKALPFLRKHCNRKQFIDSYSKNTATFSPWNKREPSTPAFTRLIISLHLPCANSSLLWTHDLYGSSPRRCWEGVLSGANFSREITFWFKRIHFFWPLGNTAGPMYLFKSLPSESRIPSRLCQAHADLATSGCVQPHCSHIFNSVQVILTQSCKEHCFLDL